MKHLKMILLFIQLVHTPLCFINRDDCLRVSMHPLRLKERSQVPVHLLINKKLLNLSRNFSFVTSGGPTGTALQKGSGQCCGKSVFQHLQSKLKKGLGSNTLQQATLISPSTHLLPSGPRGREISVFDGETHTSGFMDVMIA